MTTTPPPCADPNSCPALVAVVKRVEERFDATDKKVDNLDGKLDLVLEKLLPLPIDQTLAGRMIADPAVRKAIALALVLGTMAVTGIAISGDMLRGIVFSPAVADDAAGESASNGNDVDDGGASAPDSPTPGESQP